MHSDDIESIINRITSHQGVKALIIMNKEGLLLKTNMEMNPTTEQLITNIHDLTISARRLVRDVDPHDDLMFLRTKSNTDEILISPDVSFTVVVIQEVTETITVKTSSTIESLQ
uniref:Roadblock/LAMTOR2 domain-containing protein n=1 Tax=Arion vulgaris TaxID=1028688 RepID=A0A0B6YW15_9EUPU